MPYVNIWVLDDQTAEQNFTGCKADLSKGLLAMMNRDLLKNIRRTADSDWYNTDRSESDWKWGSIGSSKPQKQKQVAPTRFAKSDVDGWAAKTQASYMSSPNIVMRFINNDVELKDGEPKPGWFWQAKIGFAKHPSGMCARVGSLNPKALAPSPKLVMGITVKWLPSIRG